MPRRTTKRHTILENALCLDLRHAFSTDNLQLDFWGAGYLPLLRWDRPHGFVDAKFDFRGGLSAWIELLFFIRGERVSQRLSLSASIGKPFGGKRWFFVCPETGRRIRSIYRPVYADRFLSRHAHRLAYAVERMTDYDREIEKTCRVYRAITGADPEFGALTLLPKKPIGMHWSTFEELVKRYASCQERIISALVSEFNHDQCSSEQLVSRFYGLPITSELQLHSTMVWRDASSA